MLKFPSKRIPFLLPTIAVVSFLAFFASCLADASPRLVRLAAIAENLLRCPSGKAPSGFQFFRLLRAFTFLPLLLATAWAWHLRQVRQGTIVPRGTFCNWLAILFGCFLRIDLWATKSFWCDTWSLKAGITTHSAMELLTGPLGFNQSAPVGFSLFSKVIGSLTGNSNLALTFPLLLISCLNLVMLSHLVRKRLCQKSPLVADLFVFVFSVNPSFVYYGAEFKPYGVDLLMSTLALTILFRFQSGTTHYSELLLFSILAPALSLPSFFVLPFLYLALLVHSRKEKKTVFRLCLCGLIAAPFAAFVLAHAFATMPAAMDNIQDLFAPVSVTKETVHWWLVRILRSFRGPAYFGFTTWDISLWGFLLSTIPLGLFLIGAWRARRESWLWMSLGVIAATAFASACHYWKINPGASLTSGRLILFLAPFAYLPLAYGLSWIFQKNAVVGRAIFGFAAASCSLFFVQQVPTSWPMDSIASRIVSEWTSGDVLFTDEIMLLSLLDSNEIWVKEHASDIRMIYSSPSYDDLEFRSLDTYTPNIKRILSNSRAQFLQETERDFGRTTGGFLLFYALHGDSRDTANHLRGILPTAIRDTISAPFFELFSF